MIASWTILSRSDGIPNGRTPPFVFFRYILLLGEHWYLPLPISRESSVKKFSSTCGGFPKVVALELFVTLSYMYFKIPLFITRCITLCIFPVMLWFAVFFIAWIKFAKSTIPVGLVSLAAISLLSFVWVALRAQLCRSGSLTVPYSLIKYQGPKLLRKFRHLWTFLFSDDPEFLLFPFILYLEACCVGRRFAARSNGFPGVINTVHFTNSVLACTCKVSSDGVMPVGHHRFFVNFSCT